MTDCVDVEHIIKAAEAGAIQDLEAGAVGILVLDEVSLCDEGGQRSWAGDGRWSVEQRGWKGEERWKND